MGATVSLRYRASGGSLHFVDAAGVRRVVPGGGLFETDPATAALLLSDPLVVEEGVGEPEPYTEPEPVTASSGAEAVVEGTLVPTTGAITLSDIPTSGKRGRPQRKP